MFRLTKRPIRLMGLMQRFPRHHSSVPLSDIMDDDHIDITTNINVTTIPKTKEDRILESYNKLKRHLYDNIPNPNTDLLEEYDSNGPDNLLWERQLKIEAEQITYAEDDRNDITALMTGMKKGTNFKANQKVYLGWMQPLMLEIINEVEAIKAGRFGKDRRIYGEYLLSCTPEKLAMTTLNITLNNLLQVGNKPLPIIKIAKEIGYWVECETTLARIKLLSTSKVQDELTRNSQYLKREFEDSSSLSNKKWHTLMYRTRQTLEVDPWSEPIKIKVGCALLALLINSAKTSLNENAILYEQVYNSKQKKSVGCLSLHEEVYKMTVKFLDDGFVGIRHLPMLIPPRKWTEKGELGCYLALPTNLMRTESLYHRLTIRRLPLTEIKNGLDYLGAIPWKINKNVFKVMKEVVARKENIGDIPQQFDYELPKEDNYYSEEAYERTLQKIEEAKEDGRHEKVLQLEKLLRHESRTALDQFLYYDMKRRIETKNNNLHSLRCDNQIKFGIAERFLDDRLYFPINLDFRGRAYPIPPNLSIVGSDISRSLLMFDEGKALGTNGLNWLKIHLCNLFGNNKISHHDRIKWADDNMDKIISSAEDPLDENRWWADADYPFQALAACIEINNALKCDDPSTYVCSLPCHQDGSCNGLQHYAALGRDESGGKAVNLTPGDKPADVYTGVLGIVLRRVKADKENIPGNDANESEIQKYESAALIHDIVDRGVIKQTVMTSVYGVTSIGARNQIQARLNEKIIGDASAIATREQEAKVYHAACYLAGVTLDSITEMFSNARSIMQWLTLCAKAVASTGHPVSWITPLGLPVMQPYRIHRKHIVKTLLQTVTLTHENDSLPVSKQKQGTAFPPNFVHSLDATHMLLTAKKMEDAGLTFASVHDSYWTHPSDVDFMNAQLREAFVDLYSKPILEDLLESLQLRYPSVEFPPIPNRGNLNLELVKESKFFFH